MSTILILKETVPKKEASVIVNTEATPPNDKNKENIATPEKDSDIKPQVNMQESVEQYRSEY